MLSHLSPLVARVATYVKPEDLLLTKGAWVKFSAQHKKSWARGKLFEVIDTPMLVNYPVSYILPGDDYKDIDLSNATGGLNLYPEAEYVLYQIALGFKPGDYIVHIYISGTDKYIYRLAETSMYPDISSATLKYLGAFDPESSPFDAPLLFLYAIKGVDPIYLRPYVLEGVDYEKVTMLFKINKCKLREIENPTEEQLERALYIPYYEELTGW